MMKWLSVIGSGVSAIFGGSTGLIVIGIACFCAGMWAGYEGNDTLHLARQASTVQKQHTAFVQAVIDGALDAAALRKELVAAETTNAELKRRLAHVPTLSPVARPADCPVCDLRVSAGAVGLWNDALTGSVSPGACGAAGAASGACLVATDLTADDLAANHSENAASCRADRIKLQRLIDHLQRRQR